VIELRVAALATALLAAPPAAFAQRHVRRPPQRRLFLRDRRPELYAAWLAR